MNSSWPSFRTFLFAVALVSSGGADLHAQCPVERQIFVGPGVSPAGHSYGFSLATEGDTLVVGCPELAHPDAGAAFLYERVGDQWRQTLRLTPTSEDDHLAFGVAVALSGDHLLIGSPYRFGGPDGFDGAGRVYAFERIGGAWVQVGVLTSASISGEDYFGWHVSLAGDRALVSAHCENGRVECEGAAYFFEWDGGAWVQTAQLRPDPVSVGFATQIAFDGEVAAISENSGTAVFERIGGTWTRTARLDFDGTLAIHDGRIVCGGRSYYPWRQLGAASVLDRVGGVWTLVARLTPPDLGWGESYGDSVVVRGDLVLVGCYWSNDPVDPQPRPGRVCIFERRGNDWAYVGSLGSSRGVAADYFGFAFAMSGKTACVSALRDFGFLGGVYAFDLPASFDFGSGNVNRASGPVENVLFVNSGTGAPPYRSVEIPGSDPFELRIAAPSSMPAGARYALYVWRGTPSLQTCDELPGEIGPLVFPSPMSGRLPHPVRIANNLGSAAEYGTEFWPYAPTAPAPTILVSRPLGTGRHGTFYLQGIVEDAQAPNGQLAVTNGIAVRFR